MSVSGDHHAHDHGRATPPAGRVARSLVLYSTLAACVAIVALTAAMVSLQWNGIDRAAQVDSRHLASVIADGMPREPAAIQAYIERQQRQFDRDLSVVDVHGRVLADIDRSEIGKVFDAETGSEIVETLADGLARSFMEYLPNAPRGRPQVAVPLWRDGPDGREIAGVLVLEATQVRDELRSAAALGLAGAAAAGLICIAVVAVFGVRLARSLTTLTDELHASHETLAREREKERRAAEQVEYLAYHDKLTGLPNRSLLSRTLLRELDEARLRGTRLALVFVDLDRFKNINDTLGHEAGDRFLQEAAARLRACVRAGDLVARLGGDEFVVLVTGLVDDAALENVAAKILAALTRAVSLDGREFQVTASLGLAVCPRDGEDERTLMKKADLAMYRAKEAGNGYAFYRPEYDRDDLDRLAFEASLRRAVDLGQFEVHYQPKVACGTGAVTGVEALLRWPHPEQGMISPAAFIPVAEETGLIVEIGRWVLHTVCRQHADWIAQGLPPIPIAVNLSARQLGDDHLVDDVRAALAGTGMDAAMLELELTESMLMRDVERATRLLGELKALGLQLSVDDFGTGYSSLATLKNFPVDTIKIDRSFIRDLSTCDDDRALADAIISMGRTLSLTVVAEGVETTEQAEFLRAHGCDEFQGFLFSRPVPAERLRAFVETREVAGLGHKDPVRRALRSARLLAVH